MVTTGRPRRRASASAAEFAASSSIPSLPLEDLGEISLRNVEAPVHSYHLLAEGAVPSAARALAFARGREFLDWLASGRADCVVADVWRRRHRIRSARPS